MQRIFRFCPDFLDNVKHVQTVHACKECWDFLDNVKNVQLLRQCEECSDVSDNAKNAQIFQTMLRMFTLFRQC
jgi:hypothetical protein